MICFLVHKYGCCYYHQPMRLDKRQFEMLASLVEIRSHYDENADAQNENAILEKIEELFKDCNCKIKRIPIKNEKGKKDKRGRWNLVVEKGRGEKCVMLYAHVDTFSPKQPVKNKDYKLRPWSGKVHGVGVRDMKAGVMEIIDLMRETDVSEGMKWVGVFSPDEELHSRGAKDRDLQAYLMKFDFVAGMSPEIGVSNDDDKNFFGEIIMSRRGVLKSNSDIETETGHGALLMMNASRVHHAYKTAIMAMIEDNPRMYLGVPEQIEEVDVECDKPKDLSQPYWRVSEWKHFIVPGNSLANAMLLQRKTAERVREALLAQRRIPVIDNYIKIDVTQSFGVASYEPYGISLDNPIGAKMRGAAQEIFGGYRESIALSPSDGNVFVPMFQAHGKNVVWIEGSALGGREHSIDEWADADSIVRHINFTRTVLRRIPDALGEMA